MSDPFDTAVLAAAYADFFSEAERGGFGPPPEGEWNAEQVVAHIALNDRAMMVVGQTLLSGKPAAFRNEAVQEPDALAAWIAECGGMEGLVVAGRKIAAEAVAQAEKLSPEQHQTMVDCRFVSDGKLAYEGPMQWGMVAVSIQATKHLVGHIEQLQSLR